MHTAYDDYRQQGGGLAEWGADVGCIWPRDDLALYS